MSWSDWLEFNSENVSKVPQRAGVFRMHTAMKMMYIGNAENLQKRLDEALAAPCTSDAKRFCYMETNEHEKIKDDLLNDYKQRHDGKLPKCMEEQ
jgi:excinuclease UvrABC nuclease subunit